MIAWYPIALEKIMCNENVPELFGQPNIANILSWQYLWDPYGGFGRDGRQ